MKTTLAPVHRALAKFEDSPTKMANALSLPEKRVLRQSIEHWRKEGVIPLEYVRPIHDLCEGDPAAWESRPLDWWVQWPDLVGSPGAPGVPQQPETTQEA